MEMFGEECWELMKVTSTVAVIFELLRNLSIPRPRLLDSQCVVTVVVDETWIGFGTHHVHLAIISAKA